MHADPLCSLSEHIVITVSKTSSPCHNNPALRKARLYLAAALSSCMLSKVSKEGLLLEAFSEAAAQRPQKKLTDERSIEPRPSDAATERDPRRSRGLSPNSRQSRRRPRAEPSSHPQDRDNSMDGSTSGSHVSCVGIDVSKAKFDVMIVPQGTRLTCPYDAQGISQLRTRFRRSASSCWKPPADTSDVWPQS